VPERSTIVDFHCDNCGQKISVPEGQAGKKGKCPKCDHLVVVPKQTERAGPDKSSHLVSLACLTCGQEIQVPESSRGKLIECPHCGSRVEAPVEQIPAEGPEAPAQKRREDVVDGLSLEERQLLDGEIRVDHGEQTRDRKLPWLVDIFLYPTTASGMIHMGVFVIVPILIGLLNRFVLSYARHYGVIVSAILYIFLIGYMFYYFVECIRDSAAGGVRAPELLGSTLGKDEMIEQYITLFACYAFFFGPTTFYRGYVHFSNAQINNAIFWPLLAYGAFFFPMGILAVVMFDSINGLNPILLICSIASTFFQYCALIIFVCIIGFLPVALNRILPQSLITGYISSAVRIYLIMVMAHLLGRFYRRHQGKLNWEV
jgi:DNA-directed RNA polymerase subunit RPC12/RpoP